MSKKITYVLISIIAVMVAIWIWTFSSITKTPIVIGGSTSANSFMQEVTTGIRNVDYTYNSTGSQNGANGVYNGIYTGGVLSKSFDLSSDERFGIAFNNGDDITDSNIYSYINNKKDSPDKFTALNLALDSIVVIYNPPGDIVGEKNEEINFNKKENDGTILKQIYDGKIKNWNELDGKYNGIIKPFTRETGSGTKTEFEKAFGINNSVGSNVANSNGMMFSNIEQTDGSIGFVSLPFVSQIEKKSKVFVAGIDGKRLGYKKDTNSDSFYESTSEADNPKKDGIECDWQAKDNETNFEAISNQDYSLTRPFIMLYKNSSIEKLIVLLKKILNNSDDIFKEQGLVKKMHDLK